MDIKKTAARLAMARGTIVLDENVQSLQTPLRKKNIRVLCPKPGTSDPEIVETLLANRILVTNNSKDFIRDASSYDFGIIALDDLSFKDPSPSSDNKTVKLISDVFVDYELWSKKHGFILRLKDDGNHEYKDLVD